MDSGSSTSKGKSHRPRGGPAIAEKNSRKPDVQRDVGCSKENMLERWRAGVPWCFCQEGRICLQHHSTRSGVGCQCVVGRTSGEASGYRSTLVMAGVAPGFQPAELVRACVDTGSPSVPPFKEFG